MFHKFWMFERLLDFIEESFSHSLGEGENMSKTWCRAGRAWCLLPFGSFGSFDDFGSLQWLFEATFSKAMLSSSAKGARSSREDWKQRQRGISDPKWKRKTENIHLKRNIHLLEKTKYTKRFSQMENGKWRQWWQLQLLQLAGIPTESLPAPVTGVTGLQCLSVSCSVPLASLQALRPPSKSGRSEGKSFDFSAIQAFRFSVCARGRVTWTWTWTDRVRVRVRVRQVVYPNEAGEVRVRVRVRGNLNVNLNVNWSGSSSGSGSASRISQWGWGGSASSSG